MSDSLGHNRRSHSRQSRHAHRSTADHSGKRCAVTCCRHAKPCKRATDHAAQDRQPSNGSSKRTTNRKVLEVESEHSDTTLYDSVESHTERINPRKQTPNAALRQPPKLFDERLMLSTTSTEGYVWPQAISHKGRKQQPQEYLPSNKAKDSVYENIDAVDLTDVEQPPTPPTRPIPEQKRRSSTVASRGRINDGALSPEQRYYLGLRTRGQAQRRCKKPATFRLYHLLPSSHPSIEQITDSLQLMVVYCTSEGDFCHYPVREQHRSNGTDTASDVYVDYGSPETPKFDSLDNLVQYFSTYVLLRKGLADVFP